MPAKYTTQSRGCRKCGSDYPRTNEFFYRSKRSSDGLESQCRFCRKAAARQYHLDNPELVSAKRKARYWNDPIAARAAMRQWAADNPERYKLYLQRRQNDRYRAARCAYAKRYREQFPDRIRERRRKDIARNPDKERDRLRTVQQNRRARLRGQFVESVTMAVLYARDGGVCVICQRAVAQRQATIDHIIPIARGGEHSYRNVQLAHRQCNQKRSAYGPAQTRLLGV